MRSTTLWTVAVVLLGATATSTTTANGSLPPQQCGSFFEPQNYPADVQTENENYFHIEPISIKDTTVERLRDFTDNLNGRWRGTAIDIRCRISDDKPHTTVNNYDVDAAINKNFLGALIMEVQQENDEQVVLDEILLSPKTELDASLELGLDTNTLGQRTGSRNFRVDFTSPDTLVFNQKYRRVTKRVPPLPLHTGLITDEPSVYTRNPDRRRVISNLRMRLIQEVKTVSFQNAELTVNRDIYINGKFVSQQQWQLERI